MTLDPRQRLVRVIIRLFYQPQLFSLTLVESGLDAVGLLQPLERQDEQLRVVLVRQRREGDRGEAPGLQPVDCGRVDGYGLLWRYVGTVLRNRCNNL